MGERVYAVHATRPEEVGSVEVIFSDEQAARDYAISRSTDTASSPCPSPSS